MNIPFMYNRFLPRLATASPLRVYTLLKSYWTIEKQWYNVLHAQWWFLLFICGWRHISKVLFFRFVLKFWLISGVVLGGKNFALIKLNFNNASPKSVGCAHFHISFSFLHSFTFLWLFHIWNKRLIYPRIENLSRDPYYLVCPPHQTQLFLVT